MGIDLVSGDEPRELKGTKHGAPELVGHPWITYLALAACAAIFLGITAQGQSGSWDAMERFGYASPGSLWDRAYWALVTSAFVHVDPLHLAFNGYWLWMLGSRLERTIGAVPYLAFIVASAFVSSSVELAFSGDMGIGASGVAYAMFGFMWLARDRYPHFQRVVTPRTAQIFLAWMVACIVATALQVWEVGNAAHVSGLAFGLAVAGSTGKVRVHLCRAGLSLLAVLSMVPLFWSPWSVSWLSHQAYEAVEARRYRDAVDLLNRVLRLDPKSVSATVSRAAVYEELGDKARADADHRRALELDPSLEEWDSAIGGSGK